MRTFFGLVLMLVWINSHAEQSEAQRVYPIKYDPILKTFEPPRIPSANLENGQRYRLIIMQKNIDGSIQARRYVDFTYTGPTHPPGSIDPLMYADPKTMFPSPGLAPVKIFGSSPNGDPYVKDASWTKGVGLNKSGDRKYQEEYWERAKGAFNPDTGITEIDNINLPTQKPSKTPKNKDSKDPVKPKQQSPDYTQDVQRAAEEFGKNLMNEMVNAFRDTPDDRRRREAFEKRQREILERQQELENKLYDKKVESAALIARALTLFNDSGSVRPSVSEVRSRIDYALRYGDPVLRERLALGINPSNTEKNYFQNEYGKNAMDFLTTTYKPVSQAQTFYTLFEGKDFYGSPASPGKMAGIVFNYARDLYETVRDPLIVYASVQTMIKGIVKVAPHVEKALLNARPLFVGGATTVAVALYSPALNDYQPSAIEYIKDPSMRNAAKIFFSSGEIDNNSNLAVDALGEKYAAWGDPHIKMDSIPKAKEMFDFISDWKSKNPNAGPVDRGIANIIHQKLQIALEIKLPEPSR